MITQELLDYIKSQLARGASKDTIRQKLATEGWPEADITGALNKLISTAPQVQPVSAPPVSEQQPQQPIQTQPTVPIRRPFNKKLAAMVTIVIALLIGSSALAYPYLFPKPEQVIDESWQNISAIKSLEYGGELNGKTSAVNVPSGSFQFKFSGVSDWRDQSNLKASLTAELTASTAQPSQQISFDFELRTIGKVFYARLTKIPTLPVPLPIDLNTWQNKWVKIDPQKLAETFLGQLGPDQLKQFEEQLKKSPEQQLLKPDDIVKIQNALLKNPVVKITAKLPEQEINSSKTFHYRYALNTGGLKNLILEITKIIAKEKLAEKDLAELKKGIEKSFQQINFQEGEIWITKGNLFGKNDRFPAKITFAVSFKESDKPGSESSAGPEGQKANAAELLLPGKPNAQEALKLDGIISLKNFNQPVLVETPPEAMPLEEIIKQFATTPQQPVPFKPLPPKH